MSRLALALALTVAACRSSAPAGEPAASGPAPAPSSAPAPPTPPPATAAPAGPGGPTVTLVFAASQAGQLVPCGCSPDQRGGLPRAVALVRQLRGEAPGLLYIDGGDTLSAGPVPASGLGQATLKARTLAAGDQLLGAAARVAGARDLALGAAFVAGLAGEAVGPKLLDAGAPVPGSLATLLAPAGAVQVGLFAAGLDAHPEQTIAARAAQLRSAGARLVVAILHVEQAQATALLPAAGRAGVDLVLLGHRADPAVDADLVVPGAPPLLAVEGHGQSLLRVDVRLTEGPPSAPLFLSRGAEGKAQELKALDERIARYVERAQGAAAELKPALEGKIAELREKRAQAASAVETAPPGSPVATVRFLPLGADVPDDADAKALVARYDDEVARKNLADAKTLPAACPRPAKGEAAFIGVGTPAGPAGESCADCHQTEARFWTKTGHARAYATLAKVNKQFNLDCIRCHVSGWQQPGGVCRIDLPDRGGPGVHASGDVFGLGRRDVQCEMCHGPASLHAKDPENAPLDARVPVSTCVRCHEPANSPHFDDAKYRPWIVGPGHGAPLASGEEPGPRGPAK